MPQLFALLPLVIFFCCYLWRGIYVATAALMISLCLLCLIEWLVRRRVARLHLLSTALVVALGGATLVLHNPLFIKWKPTVLFWILALAFLLSGWMGEQPLAQRLLQPAVPAGHELPRAAWRWLNLQWVVWGLLFGALNLWLAYRAPERVWVYFKLLGLPLALMGMTVSQALWLQKRAAPAAAGADHD